MSEFLENNFLLYIINRLNITFLFLIHENDFKFLIKLMV